MAASSDGPRRPALHLLSVAVGFALCMILSGLEAHFTTGGAGQPGTPSPQGSNASTDGSAQQLCGLPQHPDAVVMAARRDYQQLLLKDAQRRFATKVVRFAGAVLAHVSCHVTVAGCGSLLHAAGAPLPTTNAPIHVRSFMRRCMT